MFDRSRVTYRDKQLAAARDALRAAEKSAEAAERALDDRKREMVKAQEAAAEAAASGGEVPNLRAHRDGVTDAEDTVRAFRTAVARARERLAEAERAADAAHAEQRRREYAARCRELDAAFAKAQEAVEAMATLFAEDKVRLPVLHQQPRGLLPGWRQAIAQHLDPPKPAKPPKPRKGARVRFLRDALHRTGAFAHASWPAGQVAEIDPELARDFVGRGIAERIGGGAA